MDNHEGIEDEIYNTTIRKSFCLLAPPWYHFPVPTLTVVGEEASCPAHCAAVDGDARLGEADAGALAHARHRARPDAQPGLGAAQVLLLPSGMLNSLVQIAFAFLRTSGSQFRPRCAQPKARL